MLQAKPWLSGSSSVEAKQPKTRSRAVSAWKKGADTWLLLAQGQVQVVRPAWSTGTAGEQLLPIVVLRILLCLAHRPKHSLPTACAQAQPRGISSGCARFHTMGILCSVRTIHGRPAGQAETRWILCVRVCCSSCSHSALQPDLHRR